MKIPMSKGTFLMSNSKCLPIVMALMAIVWIAAPVHAEENDSVTNRRPNILLILADDMGYGDLGCMGVQYLRTPKIDAIATRGVLCRQGYVASAVCSPSRAGLLTGRDPRRFGYEGNLNKSAEGYAARPDLLGLPTSEQTIADYLKAAGYATALIGKWHQGDTPQFHPNRRGFDHFTGMLGGSHIYFPTADNNQLERDGEPLKEFSSPYVTDFFTDEGLAWLKSRDDQPWFLFMAYNAPHTPMQAKEADLALYENIQDEKRRTYAAMVHALDRGVGRLIDYLRTSDQLDNTLVVFLSDNGGASNNASWNGPLSGCKGTLREGGVRVPFIVSWPAALPQGVQRDGAVSSLDLLPTFLAAAQAKPLPERPPLPHEDKRNRRRYDQAFGRFDGENILPLLKGETPAAERLLHWRLQGQTAVLSGDLKLITLIHRPAQLFTPATDLGEAHDLATQRPEDLAEMFKKLSDWESRLPTVPIWDSSPFWFGDSAKLYDTQKPRPEPK